MSDAAKSLLIFGMHPQATAYFTRVGAAAND